MRQISYKEHELVELLKQGDRQTFEWFYEHTHHKLLAWMREKVGSKADAEELVHDVYLSFLDSLPLFLGRSLVKTFLYAIARHEVADYFRKKYAKKALAIVPFVDHIYTEKLYSATILNEEIEAVYRKLSPEYVVILRLKYEESLHLKEIAKRLSLSLKATESRLFRARSAFQKAYGVIYGSAD